MSAVDEKVDAAADKLDQLAQRAATEGGVKSKAAQPLADDAQFLRKLKPSLIKARAKGKLPTGGTPGHAPVPAAGKPPKSRGTGRGPNPWLVIGVAFAGGVVLAKWLDWRGHAHPRN
jgi:hypothetical protein